jgi:hypothetical protein
MSLSSIMISATFYSNTRLDQAIFGNVGSGLGYSSRQLGDVDGDAPRFVLGQ